jgi:hypothetical protein
MMVLLDDGECVEQPEDTENSVELQLEVGPNLNGIVVHIVL